MHWHRNSTVDIPLVQNILKYLLNIFTHMRVCVHSAHGHHRTFVINIRKTLFTSSTVDKQKPPHEIR